MPWSIIGIRFLEKIIDMWKIFIVLVMDTPDPWRDLPCGQRVSLLVFKAPFLLIFTDMKKKFDNYCATFNELPFKIID